MTEGHDDVRGAALRAGDRIDRAAAGRLRELPPGAVIVDDDGDCAQQGPAGAWWWMGAERSATVDEVVAEAVWPLVVLWLPTRPDQLDPAYWSPGAASADEAPPSAVVPPPVPATMPAWAAETATVPTLPARPRRRGWGWVLAACLVVGLVLGFVGATFFAPDGDGSFGERPASPPTSTAR